MKDMVEIITLLSYGVGQIGSNKFNYFQIWTLWENEYEGGM